MAEELTITVSFKFADSIGTDLSETLTKKITVSGKGVHHTTQTVGTAEEALSLSTDVGVGGYLIGINRDPTNYISIRAASAAANWGKVKAGEPFAVRVVSAAPFVIADTAACRLELWWIPD